MLPTKNTRNDSQTYVSLVSLNYRGPACHFTLTFLFLFHLWDPLLGLGTNFTVLSSFLSSAFDTPWNFFHISIVLTEKQLNEQLALPNSHISIESSHRSKQLVDTWKTGIFLSMKNSTKRPKPKDDYNKLINDLYLHDTFNTRIGEWENASFQHCHCWHSRHWHNID